LVGIGAIAALAVGSFLATQALVDDGPGTIVADEPTPNWANIDAAVEEDRAKPRFNGVVNGIRLYDPDVGPPRQGTCGDAPSRWVSIDRAAGTPLDIRPTYLPPGVVEASAFAVECDGVVDIVERRYHGGVIGTITRYRGEQAIDILAPRDRIKPITVAGKRAVLIEPITPLHTTYIAVAEEFGITAANGDDPDEMIKVLESLR
jgi:hypothetical protein